MNIKINISSRIFTKIFLSVISLSSVNNFTAQPGLVGGQASVASAKTAAIKSSDIEVTLPKSIKDMLSPKQQKELIDIIKYQTELSLLHPYHTNTAKSMASPAAVPMMWGGLGIGGSVWNRYPTAKKNSWSGNGVIALPFGNSDKYVGGSIGVNIDSLGKHARFAKHGAIGANLSKWLGKTTIATLGAGSLVPWGDFKDGAKTYYGAVTQEFGLPLGKRLHQMSVSGGLGTGGYAPAGSTRALHDSKVYPFVNTAFNFTNNLAVAADYYSQTYAVGASYNFNMFVPVGIVAYASNLRHTNLAPSTSYGLRVAIGLPLPAGLRNFN